MQIDFSRSCESDESEGMLGSVCPIDEPKNLEGMIGMLDITDDGKSFFWDNTTGKMLNLRLRASKLPEFIRISHGKSSQVWLRYGNTAHRSPKHRIQHYQSPSTDKQAKFNLSIVTDQISPCAGKQSQYRC